MKLSQAYLQCEAIIKKHSQSFYMAFKDLPLHKRQGVYAVYGFCRVVDDAIDEDEDLQTLYTFASAIDQLSQMDETQPILYALSDTVQRFSIPLQPFKDMIVGQEMDIVFDGIEDEAALLKYSYHVASSVGLMLLPILASEHHEQITPSAIELGYAMQITNILRDVGEDYHQKSRIYLPKDELNDDVMQAIQTKKVNEAFIQVWERLAGLAETFYDNAIQDLKYYDDDALVSMTQAIVYYRGILNAVREANYDCLSQRCRVKNFITLQNQVKQIVSQAQRERAIG
ncbi:MAG: phytoene/squalene synthase family protein [Erysipelothrix sp.]|jgi:phytoene synthase|nr:phytoene/squalene synthase family protein [Erysipelothrix sp.]MBS3987930.1 phytoene/squalene synthase family protein [Erysipelothrix sp.]